MEWRSPDCSECFSGDCSIKIRGSRMSIHWLISISAVEANWNCSCCDLKVHVRGWKQKGPEHPLEFSEIHRQEMKGTCFFCFLVFFACFSLQRPNFVDLDSDWKKQ